MGWVVMMVWVGMLLLLVSRFDRVVEAAGGPWDARLAVLTVGVSLLSCWVWSWRRLSEQTTSVDGMSQWGLAARAFLKNRTALLGLGIIVGFYLVANIQFGQKFIDRFQMFQWRQGEVEK